MSELTLVNLPKKAIHYAVSTHGLVALTSGVSPLVLWAVGALSWSWALWLMAPLAVLGFAIVGLVAGLPDKPLPESAWFEEHLLLTQEPSLEYAISTQEKTGKWLHSEEAENVLKSSVRTSLLDIMVKINGVLRQLEKSNQSEVGYEVLKIATYHLPKAISAYIEVPMSHVDDLKNENGKTANMLLQKALEEFAGVVDKVDSKIAAKGLDALSLESHIVNKKYGANN